MIEEKETINPLLTKSTYPSNHLSSTQIQMNKNEIQSATISFENINYTLNPTSNMKWYQKWTNLFSCFNRTLNKQILFNLSGVFQPGMNAILGPTGCGKTTLLDILADRKDSVGLSGQVLLSGKPRPAHYKNTVGYVVQDDILCGTLTVRENLMFSATIRLPRSFSSRVKIDRVNQIIDDLDLQSCINTLIGTAFVRGVSGGERKRTSIGMELVLSPKILFLDEPTTGLDASTAQNVMTCLYNLSRQGHTIIFSIHQPRYSIFKLFDTVLFLSNGHTIYLGSPVNVLSYFSSHGFKCEEYVNPADFVLDTLIESNGQSSKILQEAYLHSKMSLTTTSSIKSITTEHDDSSSSIKRKSQSCLTELYYLSQRAIRNAIRNPEVAASQTFIAVSLALLTGLLFNNMKTTIEPGVPNRLGAIFFLSTHQVLCTASALEPLIKERILFVHENSGGYYRVWTYFVTKIVCDLIPMRLIPTFIFSIITYPLTGFQRSIDRFFVFFITIFVSSVFGSTLCFFISACVPVFAISLSLAVLSFCMMMVFSGFLVDVDSIFSFLQWLKWISAIRYSSNLLTINEFKNLKFCLSNNTSICSLAGEQILKQRHIPYDTDWDIWKNLLAMAIMAVVFFILTFIRLLYMKK